MYKKIRTYVHINGTVKMEVENMVPADVLENNMEVQRAAFANSVGIKSIIEGGTTIVAVYEQGTTVVINYVL
jgi:hypothetical protein